MIVNEWEGIQVSVRLSRGLSVMTEYLWAGDGAEDWVGRLGMRRVGTWAGDSQGCMLQEGV